MSFSDLQGSRQVPPEQVLGGHVPPGQVPGRTSSTPRQVPQRTSSRRISSRRGPPVPGLIFEFQSGKVLPARRLYTRSCSGGSVGWGFSSFTSSSMVVILHQNV